MRPNGSTLRGPRGGRAAGLRQLARRLQDETTGPLAHADLAALILPMVRRAVRTDHGPAALVGWLRQQPGTFRASPKTDQALRRLSEDLVRLLFDPPSSLDDTLDDA
ncbi:hypothetical protein [Frigoriglobus tundricola]|uniref:Uncharacterized protein n=1 Tax=Frigoriglobus tundricola TaxID=2774151 RepID=A0A6M5Z0T9_9BACT|nr:hypothetical protein [Frigoriglobus tundricola]QJW99414.1 hypothetical protein FTUN_7026 [Frigoriglobus tundricola]